MSWIQTYTGRAFDLADPQPDQVHIADIAHALSMQCRFNGHCFRHYSVGEHSLRVSRIVPDNLRLEALLHDAAEAYLMDVPRPIKPLLKGYTQLEERVAKVVAERFKVDLVPMLIGVKHADSILLATEKRDLMAPPPKSWAELPNPLPDPIGTGYVDPSTIEIAFITAFYSYGGK